MDYIPATEKDIQEMLKLIGVDSINDLVKELSPPFTDKLIWLSQRASLN